MLARPAGSTPAGPRLLRMRHYGERGMDMATKAKAEAASPPVEYACGMDKIRDELAKDSRQYVQVVGEFLTGYLLKHPEVEEKIMAEGKSIAGSLKAMEDAARKARQGSVAVLDDRTAFGIVLGYFGIEDGEVVPATRTSSVSADALPPSPEGKAFGETADVSQSLPPVGKVAPASPGSDEVPVAHAPADPIDLDALMGVL